MIANKKKRWSRSVVSNSLRPYGLLPTRLLSPWGFSRQEYWSGFPFPSPWDLPDPRIEPGSPTLQADFLPSEPPGNPDCWYLQLLCSVTQSCPTLCDPMNCSLPGSSVHGIFQATILEWVAISSSWGSSWSRNRTRISCTAGRFFTSWAIWEAKCNC